MEHIEGRQSVLAALEARQRRISVILLRHGAHRARTDDLTQLAERCGVPIRWVDSSELDALAHGGSHGGIIAVCSPKPRIAPAALLDLVDRLREPPLLLLLEGVDDARNLAFTLRTADAMGVHAVLIKKHLWDFDPVEVSRPSSGAYERLPLVRVEGVDVLVELKRRGIRVFGCLAAARRRVHERDLAQPCLIAIGGEKRGLSGAVRAVCDRFMSIPTRGGPSSLSLSHAAAIALAEAYRQRAAAGPEAAGS